MSRLFLVSLCTLIALSGQASAQVNTELIAAWRVTVQGEARDRIFLVQRIEEKSDGVVVLQGRYGYVDAGRAAVSGEVTQTSDGRKLTLKTQADSLIVATQSADGIFSGTITYKNGVVKQVRVLRTTEPELAQAKGSPAPSAQTTVAPVTEAD